MKRIIWIGGKKYYHYDNYSTFDEAKKVANKYKKKSRYFILKFEKGYLVPYDMYALYLQRIIRL